MNWLVNSLTADGSTQKMRLLVWPRLAKVRWSTADFVLCGVCVALLAGSAVRVWRTWATLHPPAVSKAITGRRDAIGSPVEPVPVRNVADRLPPIFGAPVQDPENREFAAGVQQQPMPNMELVGVAYSADAANARAILRDTAGQLHVVSLGATLAGGAIVRTIEPGAVQFDTGGRFETLRLPTTAILAKPEPTVAPTGEATSSPVPPAELVSDTLEAQRARIEAFRRQLYDAPRQ